MKIVVTDCDHDAFTEELAVADHYGAELAFTPGPRCGLDTIAERIAQWAADADGLLVQYARIDAELMDRLPRLRSIGRYGVGYDSVDIDAATTRGIAVSNVPDYASESVSDHAIAMALGLLRDVTWQDRLTRQGQAGFQVSRPLRLFNELTFGIIGCGLIGSATARKAAGLGFRVLVNDIAATADSFQGYPAVSLEDLLCQADLVSIHTPLNESTHHLIGAAELALMKPTAFLVNTSRGPVIDSQALAQALAAGRPRGAGLDVMDPEPVQLDEPLLGADRVVFTPHIAWYSEATYSELKRRTIENVAELLSGHRPRDLVNPAVLEHPAIRALLG